MSAYARALAAAIPNARTVRIEASGHAAAFDARSSFVQLIADMMEIDGLAATRVDAKVVTQ
jgi:pimeloyl-ACP methyl ester carboxylesterase